MRKKKNQLKCRDRKYRDATAFQYVNATKSMELGGQALVEIAQVILRDFNNLALKLIAVGCLRAGSVIGLEGRYHRRPYFWLTS